MTDIRSFVSHCLLEIERLDGDIQVALDDLVADQAASVPSSYSLSISYSIGLIEAYCDVLLKVLVQNTGKDNE